MKKSLVLTLGGAALATSLLLTGCSTGGAPSGDAPAAASSPAPKATPKSTTAKFGTVYKYDDGVTVSVGAPVEFTPGQYAAGTGQAHNVKLTFTITNGTKENLNPVSLPKVSSAGVEATNVIDMDDKTLAAFAPTTVILPGGSSTWTSGFSVADPTKLIVQFSPSFKYTDAIFTNTQG